MSSRDDRPGNAGAGGEEQLFDDIREFLSSQSVDRIYDDLLAAYGHAREIVDRELRDIDEFQRMLRALERLVDEVLGTEYTPEQRVKIGEAFYLYGLAHYTLMHHALAGHDDDDDDDDDDAARPLVIYDIWFPRDIAIERADDGVYMHISDGRIDLSVYVGEGPNERGALVDLVDHWGYAAANTGPFDRDDEPAGTVPMLTIEIDYNGSELVNAEDHVDVLFFDDHGEPIVRMHVRAGDLRAIVDELQAAERDDPL